MEAHKYRVRLYNPVTKECFTDIYYAGCKMSIFNLYSRSLCRIIDIVEIW